MAESPEAKSGSPGVDSGIAEIPEVKFGSPDVDSGSVKSSPDVKSGSPDVDSGSVKSSPDVKSEYEEYCFDTSIEGFPCTTNYSSFVELEELGNGGFGTVFKCQSKIDDSIYAIKKVGFNDETVHKTVREVKVMASLSHPHIVRYHLSWIQLGAYNSSDESANQTPSEDESLTEEKNIFLDNEEKNSPLAVEDENLTPAVEKNNSSPAVKEDHPSLRNAFTHTLYIVMELCPTTLEKILDSSKLETPTAWNYFWALASALEYIHSKNIIHRDLSRQNVYVDADNNVKLADFGLSISCMGSSSNDEILSSAGNILYQAPEIKNNPKAITQKADMFSLGLILFEMMHEFGSGTERVLLFNSIRDGCFDFRDVKKECRSILVSLLQIDPSKRESAQELLKGKKIREAYM